MGPLARVWKRPVVERTHGSKSVHLREHKLSLRRIGGDDRREPGVDRLCRLEPAQILVSSHSSDATSSSCPGLIERHR